MGGALKGQMPADGTSICARRDLAGVNSFDQAQLALTCTRASLCAGWAKRKQPTDWQACAHAQALTVGHKHCAAICTQALLPADHPAPPAGGASLDLSTRQAHTEISNEAVLSLSTPAPQQPSSATCKAQQTIISPQSCACQRCMREFSLL